MGFVFFLAIAGIVIFFVITSSRTADRAWQEAAAKMKMNFSGGGIMGRRKITGTFRKCRVHIDTFTRSSGKNATTYTRIKVYYPRPLGLRLKLTRQGFFSGVARFLGGQDIEVGDTEFDDSVVVKGSRPRKVAEFLTRPRRVRINKLLRVYTTARILDSHIYYEKTGVIRDSRRLVSAVHYFVSTAESLMDHTEKDKEFDRAIQAREKGDLAGALNIIQGMKKRKKTAGARMKKARAVDVVPAKAATKSSPAPEPPRPAASRPLKQDTAAPEKQPAAAPAPEPEPEPVSVSADKPFSEPAPSDEHEIEEGIDMAEEMEMEGEILHMAGRKKEAQETFRSLYSSLPDDEHAREWASEQRREEDKPEKEATGEEPELIDPLGAEHVCRSLFEEVNSSYEADRIFEKRFKDKAVSWKGTLKSVESFTFDFVFGSREGTKALFEVYKLTESIVGSGGVVAVACFSKDEYSTLRENIGNDILISGRLLKVDGFMKNVYINGDAYAAS